MLRPPPRHVSSSAPSDVVGLNFSLPFNSKQLISNHTCDCVLRASIGRLKVMEARIEVRQWSPCSRGWSGRTGRAAAGEE